MSQDELWATSARPKRLSISVERLWDVDESTVQVTGSQQVSKGQRGLWVITDVYSGPQWRMVAAAQVERLVEHHTGAWWQQKPQRMSYDAWLDHLDPHAY